MAGLLLMISEGTWRKKVQEYRHHLFSHMFDRYLSQHHLESVNLAVLTIEGSAENYYVHVIASNLTQGTGTL